MTRAKNVLVVGNGGREHAIAWKLAQSPHVKEVFCAPGRSSFSLTPKLAPTLISASDFARIYSLCQEKKVSLVVIGPEAPLAEGLADKMRVSGLAVVGVGQKAAELEASKIFAKEFMARNGIPTAPFEVFTAKDPAIAFIREKKSSVIKCDGLASGKGVFVCENPDEAARLLEDLFARKDFGQKGRGVVIEEKLCGTELSYMAFVSGNYFVPLSTARDYKRLCNGDRGPNTGGMGAFSPVVEATPALLQKIDQKIMIPFLDGVSREAISYQGILYVGLMIVEGEPFVLEFNVRLGDPETQALLVRLQSDLYLVLEALAKGELANRELSWKDEASVCVVMAAKGYPANPVRGARIPLNSQSHDGFVFHAGTEWDKRAGLFLADGGRVLNIAATGKDLQSARIQAYALVQSLAWKGCQYRTDIAFPSKNPAYP